jgi:superfamily II DNA helicase RecQ
LFIYYSIGGIMVRIFTIPFDPEYNRFNDDEFQVFQKDHKIVGIENRFFSNGDNQYWTASVEYTEKKPARPKIILENETQERVYDALRVWRNKLAEEKRLFPYEILWNDHLKHIVLADPKNVAELQRVRTIGPTRTEKYGTDIINILQGFRKLQESQSK